MKTKIELSLILGLIGLIIISLSDWKIAVGVFICIWGNNITNSK